MGNLKIKQMKSKNAYILDLQDIDKSMLAMAGGKGANLGELSRIEAIRVPDGFCISTEAFKRMTGETPAVNKLLDQLSRLQVKNREQINTLSAEIRNIIQGITIPPVMID
jgi:phosphoenolpyruvate synthase/pyruvate phosphate dikinase